MLKIIDSLPQPIAKLRVPAAFCLRSCPTFHRPTQLKEQRKAFLKEEFSVELFPNSTKIDS